MKKGNGGIRTVVTAGILLVLVILAAWTLKHRKADEPADAEIKIETPISEEEAPGGRNSSGGGADGGSGRRAGS